MDEEMLSQGDTVQDAGSPMNVSVNEQDQSGTESEESSEEELTPEIIYNRLKLSWMNERIAPELLPNDEDVTENAKNLIDGMKQNLAGGRRGIADIKYSIHAFEVERVKYILASYFRERTKKIESRPAYYLQKRRDTMSDIEIDYAKTLIQLELGHLNENALAKVPGWREDAAKTLEKMANWGTREEDMNFVIARFIKNTTLAEDVDLDEDLRQWELGQQLILRWKFVKHPVVDFSAKLI